MKPLETSLSQSLRIQTRVVKALLMREIITRYGRHNIGFAWLFGEPMLFAGGIMLIWTFLHDVSNGHHIDVTAFALTGYATVLLWRNTIGRCTVAVEPNTALLFHRNVRVIDLFIARIVLEVAGVTLSICILMLLLVTTGLIPPPDDILRMLAAWVLLAWYSAAMGLLIGGLCEFSELIERLWHPVAYFMLPASGLFAMASWLPEKMRDLLLIFPVPNCVELFRYGYFGEAVTPYYDIPYVVTCCMVLSWLGLAVVAAASKRVEPQ